MIGQVDSIRKVAQQMTGDGIASWVIFASVIPVVCILSIANRQAHDQSPPLYGILAAAVATAIALALLLVVWKVLLRKLHGWTRIIVTFLAYMAAGACKGLLQQFILYAGGFGSWDAAALTSRILNNSFQWVVVLGLLTFTIGSNREHYAKVNQLRAQQAAVDEYLKEARSGVIADQDQIIQTVKSTVARDVDKLRESSPHDLIEDTQHFVEDTVRPLSHKLSQEVPNWSMPTIDPEATKLSWARYFRQAPIAGQLSPLWTTIALCVFAFGYIATSRSFMGVVTSYAFAAPLLFIVLFVAMRIAGLFRPKSQRGQFVINVVAVLLLAIIPFAVAVYLTANNLLPNLASVLGFLIIGLCMFILLSIGMACYEDRARIDQLAENLQEQMHWIVKRISVEIWAHHGRVARTLHGPYQGAIYSHVYEFQRKAEANELSSSDVDTLANSLVVDLENVLEADSDQQSLELALERIAAMWSDVAKIKVHYTSEAKALIENDPALSDLASSLLHDGIVNSIRHGEANEIEIHVVKDAEFAVEISVLDNGTETSEVRQAGLGSSLLDANSLEWDFIVTEDGHRLRMLLPGGTTIDEALTRQREGVRELV